MTAAIATRAATNTPKYVAMDTHRATCFVAAESDCKIVGHQEECNARLRVDL